MADAASTGPKSTEVGDRPNRANLDIPLQRNDSIHTRRFSDRLACDRVQSPRKGPFCSKHLTWFRKTAWIPENTLEDFLEGEEHVPNFNTFFKTRKTEEHVCKVSGEKMRTIKRYWCTFGPADLRDKVEQNLPESRKFDNGKVPLRHTTLTGYSVQRGCHSHFYVTRFESRAHAVKITWVNKHHVDAKGKPCHGLLDSTARFANAHVAPRLSKRSWNFVERLIRAGVSTSKIVRAHFRNLRNHWRDFFPNELDPSKIWSRDMMLNTKSVGTIRQSVLRKKVDYTTEDHLAVETWVANNKEKVFLYHARTTSDTPFVLAWATEWQIEKAVTLGQERTIAMDTTFGTNIRDLSLFTVLAYDKHQNGIPVAWALMETHKSEQLIEFLRALKGRVQQQRETLLLDPEWRPKAFIIDVAVEEILAIRAVFLDIPINLCLWHVRRAWTKNLMSKVKNPFNRADMNRDLGTLMYGDGNDPIADSEQFMSTWRATEPSFVDYFSTYWHPRLERWMKRFRKYNHQNQNTNGAIERWHHTMKMHLRTEKATKSGRSIIWLLGMLTEEMELFYWCMLALKFQGAIRNTVKETYVWASIHKARLISDDQVRKSDSGLDGSRRAEVTTYKADGTPKVHVVDNYNLDNCTCTWGHSEQGNTCKHQIKVLLLDGYTKMKLFNLLGTKWGSCCGGLEYEAEMLEEDEADESDMVQSCHTTEVVDVSFPLTSFVLLEGEPEPEAEEGYHEYNVDYWVGLVHKGWGKMEKLSPANRNQALVKLKSWVEWVSNMEAIADPPELDQFPLTPFLLPEGEPAEVAQSLTPFQRREGADNNLKRRKDMVEKFWAKKKRGKQSKAMPSDDPSKGVITKDMQEEGTGCGQTPLPFVSQTKAKESDQGRLDRFAREALDLNDKPMDYEAPTGKSVVTSTSIPVTKRKGRPPGSKNRPKVSSPCAGRALGNDQANGVTPKCLANPTQIFPGKENVSPFPFSGTVSSNQREDFVIRLAD